MRVEPLDAAAVSDVLPLVERYWEFEGIAGFDPGAVGRALERLLADPAMGRGWVSRNAGTPVAYLLLVFVFSLEHLGLTAEIDEFFVAEDQRGGGLGQRLLRAAEAACIEAGCHNLSLQVGRANHGARRFYLREGFAERPGYDLLDKDLPWPGRNVG